MSAIVFDKVLQLRLLGGIFIVLACVHGVFPRRFDWARELAALSLINRQLMTVHTFFIAVVVFLIGAVCLVDAEALVHTPLGHHIGVGLAVFWGLRLYAQLGWYSSELWRGKPFETVVHVAFTALWLWATVIFGLVGSGS